MLPAAVCDYWVSQTCEGRDQDMMTRFRHTEGLWKGGKTSVFIGKTEITIATNVDHC